MPKFMLSSEEINSNGGFSFVKKLLDGNVRSRIGLMSAGNSNYADVEKFRSAIELDSRWTNLPYSVRQCTALYHDHGTSEQFHSELKSDMGIELLSSGNLKTNALVLGLATVVFNCLRFIGQAALQSAKAPADEKSRQLRYRIRTVLLDYIKVGCKIVCHANQTIQKFGRNCHNFFTMKEAYALF